MPEPLNPNTEFVVKDSAVALLIMGIAFSAMLFCAVFYNVEHSNLILSICIGLLPMILIVLRIIKRRPAIVINKKGIFASGGKVTDWAHFVKAHFTQKQKLVSIKDDFVLIVEYRKDGYPRHFKTTIPLSNTQNKSEEAVVEAVYFYYGWHKKGKSEK